MIELEFINLLSQNNYTLISDYKNHYTTCQIKHVCGHISKTQARTFSPTTCKKCYSEPNTPKYSDSQYKELLSTSQFICLSAYTINEHRILHKCKKCDIEFNASPKNILKGQKCPGCGIFKQKPSVATKTEYNGKIYPSQFEARCAKIIHESFSDVIEQKRYPAPNHMKTCDFYIPSLNLWIETSTYKKDWYLERINKKETLVENFYFATSVTTLREFIQSLL